MTEWFSYTVSIDGKMDKTLKDLKIDLAATSKAYVFRLAVAVLKLVVDATKRGETLAIVREGEVVKELILPSIPD